MNDAFSAILESHENADRKQACNDAALLDAINREFSNAPELLRAAKDMSLSVSDILSDKVFDFPITPVRTANGFCVKKHTTSQIPYFHDCDFYELIYVHKGRCTQKFKTRADLTLTEKQCALLSPHTVHAIDRADKGDAVLKLVVPRDLFEKTGALVLQTRDNDIAVFERMTETAEFAVLKLLDEQHRKPIFCELTAQSYLTVLFAELVRPQKFDVAIEKLLNDCFETDVRSASLQALAASLNYNANYLTRLIKQKTGASFSEHLNNYRMAKARSLLTESDLSVDSIAAELGYTDASGFYKKFCATVGMTPAAYRDLFK